MDFKYDFSVVMAVYNVEQFITEAVESVINQDLGFSRIQIILVDDGSPDGSGIICDDYAKKYPDNIIAIHKENGGVSSARNEGIKYIEGRFVNFCDPDDYFSENTFSSVYNFFIEHEEKTDVVAIPIYYFGDQKGAHPRNYMFNRGDRIIDLNAEPINIQTNVNNAFIVNRKAKQIHFDETLIISEDLKEQQKLLLEKQTLGVVADCKYNYRRHNSSALNGAKLKRDYYLQGIDNCHRWIVDYYKEKNGSVPKFIQYTIMYDLQWRFNNSNIPKGVITTKEQEHFNDSLCSLLADMDDRIIDLQKNLSDCRKYYVYCKKYSSLPTKKIISGNDVYLSHRDVIEFRMSKCTLLMKTAVLENDELHLTASIELPNTIFNKFLIRVENNAWEITVPIEETGKKQFSLDEEISEQYIFSVTIPLTYLNNKIKFYLLADEYKIELGNRAFNDSKTFPITGKFDGDYFYQSGWRLYPFKKKELIVIKSSRLDSLVNRIKVFSKQIKKHKAKSFIKKRIKQYGKTFIKNMPQKYILFESLPIYSDNARKVYDYCKENKLLQNYSFIWFDNQDELPANADIKVIKPANSGLAKYIYKYYLLRSKAIIYGNRQINKIRPDQITINLGHGSCYKSVRGNYNMRDDLDYLLLQSSSFDKATRYEHNVLNSTKTVSFGYPRNDILTKTGTNTIFPGKKIIVWYPTYRQHINGRVNVSSISVPFIHNENAASLINECAEKNNVVILLKPHFVQNNELIDNYSFEGLKTINNQFFDDNGISSYELLAMSDALLTDYSSVYYDYLLVNKPIGLAWEDFEEYKTREGFAVDVDTYLAGGEKLYTVDDLCAFIERVANGEDLLKDKRDSIKQLANQYYDGTSTQKVSEWIADLIENS